MSDQPLTTNEISRQLQGRVNDLIELLRSQREILKAKGMSLPSGSLDNLRAMKSKIDSIRKQLGGNLVELQSLRALAETTALINSTLDTDSVLNQVMDTVVNLTGAERGYIVLKNQETGELDEFRVARGMDQEALGARSDDPQGSSEAFIVSRSIVNDVAESGDAVLTDNASMDERYAGRHSVVGFALRSILAVPLKVRDDVIGVVYCDNRIMDGLFQESDREILSAFANQAGVAIENARLFERTRAQLAQITEMRDLINNIFDSIVSGVITINTDGVIITCNSAATGILEAEETLGLPIEDVLPDMPDVFYDTINTVFNDQTDELLILEPHLNNRKRHWNVIISPLRGGLGVVFVLDDLTEQQERKEQLGELVKYIPGGQVNVDVTGQERSVTMIATDVRGFTRFSEKLQPEELMTIINQYLSVASDGITLYEGIVDKYMGDAVTGLFNTQLNPQEDHAIRAVRAAMSIIYDLHALHEVLPEDERLFYGIGIHTGSAYLGNVGGTSRREFSALGDAHTISKILESNAGPGEVLVSQATYEEVKDFFEFEEREPSDTKGRDDIPVVYKVLGRKKGKSTGQLFIDPELADMLKDLED